MPSLGSLWYTMGIKDLTDADFKKINDKLKNAGADLIITPKLAKSVNDILPKGVRIELDPSLKSLSNDVLAKAAEGKVMRVEIMPLLTHLRKALKDATKDNPPEMEVGIQAAKLRKLIENVLSRQGFTINISTVNDNYTKVVQQQLNGRIYKVKIHADAREITQSVQASLMQVQGRHFGLQVSRDVLYRSIDEALGQRRFPINVVVQQDQARRAVQDALLRAQVMGKDQALAYQRMQTGEMKAAQAELMRLRAAQIGATSAAKAHATASVDLGGAMGSNIKIAGGLGSAMASLYSIHAARQFLSQVVEIGGELEHQKIAMDTIFGDKGKTNELFGQIKGLARTSPFGVMELSKSVKALSAYGVEYNEIYDTAKRLADISAATSVDINRLILAFGKTKSRGFLDGLEAKQFAYANIPIYEMVRKKLEELEGQAVTTADVMARMKKREISFDIVKDVLWDITDPGGKFYNMQEALAGSVKTSWKLVRDNIDLMFGEIAEGAVGGGLKSTAEILQRLTREWRTMATFLGEAAIAFGIYKTAVAASNIMMGKATAANFAQKASSLSVRASLAQSAMAYRQLSAEEARSLILKKALDKINSKNLLTNKALTTAEMNLLTTERMLTRDSASRLIAMGKISPLQARYLIRQKLITIEDLRAAVAARKHGLSIKILGKEVTIASFRFKMLAASIGTALKSLAAFALQSLPFAAIGAGIAIWQKNNEQMEAAKELGDNIFTKVEEGARNLQKTLQGIKPSEGLSAHELTQGIEELEQAVKDYSPRPLQDINDTLVAQDGHLLTLTERYDALKKKVEGVAEAYKLASNVGKSDIGTMIADAEQSTGGLLNDTVKINARDYTNAIKERNDAIKRATIENAREVKTTVEVAMRIEGEFSKVAASMGSTEAMFNELMSHPEKYAAEHKLAGVVTMRNMSGIAKRDEDIARERDTFESDVQDFIKSLSASIKIAWEKEIDDLSDTEKDVLVIALKNMLDQADGVSEEVRQQWAQMLEKAFGIKLDLGIDASALISDEFASNMEKSLGAELAGKVRRGLTLSSEEQDKVRHAVYDSYKSVFDRSGEDVRRALNDAMRGKDLQLQMAGIAMLKSNRNATAATWHKEILDALGAANLDPIDVKVTGHSDINSFVDEARKGYKAANEAIKELKPILIKAGVDFVDGEEIEARPFYNNVTLQAIDEWNKKVRASKALKDVLNAQGIDLDNDPNKNQRTPKDKFAEDLKQRFKDIKDAWSEFQKWSKTEGRKAAATRIGESGLFSTLSKDEIPQTVEQYRELVVGLEEELRKAGVKGSARENLLNELLKQLLDIDKTIVDEQLKLALDKVTKEAERQLADWNLFDKIRKATGNKQLAMNIAFGMGVSGETDYVAMVKNQFDKVAKAAKSTLTFDTATPDTLTNAPDKVKEEWKKAYDLIQKYRDKEREDVANMVGQYRSTQEEIVALTAEAEEKKRKIRESKDLTPVEKEQITAKIDADLNYEVFRKSGEYLKFFNATLSLTAREAEKVGQKIKEALDNKLKAGQISAKDYCDEMEKIDSLLEKIRQKQKGFGGLGSFAKGGLQQMLRDRFEQAQSDYNAATTNQKEATDKRLEAEKQIAQFIRQGDVSSALQTEGARMQAQFAENAAASQAAGAASAMQGAQGTMSAVSMIDTIVHGINGIVQGWRDTFNLIADMADSFGIDTSADTNWGAAGAFFDAFSEASQHATNAWDSLKSGNVGGVITGVVGSVTSWFTVFNRWHDAKLQKQIERSQEAAKILQNQYDILEKRMANFLGNAANMNVEGYSGEGGAYGKQRQLMQGQLAELEKQRQLEIDKKKTDNSVVEDYNKQIEEMKISIQNFAMEAAKDLYGIDLNGWSEQLGDSLVDAFARGEDAAEAFDKTVGDIMRNVVSKMISQDILAPMFGDLRDFLFGKDGGSGAFGADFQLDQAEISAMKEYLDKIKNEGMPAAEELFNAINDATGGLLDETDAAKSGLSAGIQSVTEDTADLLASYINAIRASVAMNETRWERLLGESLPQIGAVAQSQLDTQRQIAENTLRTAMAAEAIQRSNDEISSVLSRVTNGMDRIYIK